MSQGCLQQSLAVTRLEIQWSVRRLNHEPSWTYSLQTSKPPFIYELGLALAATSKHVYHQHLQVPKTGIYNAPIFPYYNAVKWSNSSCSCNIMYPNLLLGFTWPLHLYLQSMASFILNHSHPCQFKGIDRSNNSATKITTVVIFINQYSAQLIVQIHDDPCNHVQQQHGNHILAVSSQNYDELSVQAIIIAYHWLDTSKTREIET